MSLMHGETRIETRKGDTQAPAKAWSFFLGNSGAKHDQDQSPVVASFQCSSPAVTIVCVATYASGERSEHANDSVGIF